MAEQEDYRSIEAPYSFCDDLYDSDIDENVHKAGSWQEAAGSMVNQMASPQNSPIIAERAPAEMRAPVRDPTGHYANARTKLIGGDRVLPGSDSSQKITLKPTKMSSFTENIRAQVRHRTNDPAKDHESPAPFQLRRQLPELSPESYQDLEYDTSPLYKPPHDISYGRETGSEHVAAQGLSRLRAQPLNGSKGVNDDLNYQSSARHTSPRSISHESELAAENFATRRTSPHRNQQSKRGQQDFYRRRNQPISRRNASPRGSELETDDDAQNWLSQHARASHYGNMGSTRAKEFPQDHSSPSQPYEPLRTYRADSASMFGGLELVDEESHEAGELDQDNMQSLPSDADVEFDDTYGPLERPGRDENELFVAEASRNNPRPANRVEKSGRNVSRGPRHVFSSADWENLDRGSTRHPAQRQAPAQFSHFGTSLAPSRYSGTPMPWPVNQVPSVVHQDEVSRAALEKRGLKPGKGEKVCKRGYGANDPENIDIVNMKETGMTFEEIRDSLNEKRTTEGKKPTLSVCAVHSRYNRTAPLLFSSQGRAFVPLSQRRGRNGSRISGAQGTSSIIWDDNLDSALVRCYKKWEASKWEIVAELFKEDTGEDVGVDIVALRYSLL